MVKVGCSAVSAGIVESELFGHERGAFTGAHSRREGRFELADKGTIFLDEIGELQLETQAKLLRVLEDRTFERVGGNDVIHTDVRVIAATNRDLAADVEAGRFRADLYYRLNVVPILVPPLRDRGGDLELLATHFLTHFSRRQGKSIEGFLPDVRERMKRYDWPGNVRELRNFVERVTLLARGPWIGPELLRDADAQARDTAGTEPEAMDLDSVERAHILRILGETDWVVDGPSGAAKVLGLNASTLRSRMQRLGIRREGHESS